MDFEAKQDLTFSIGCESKGIRYKGRNDMPPDAKTCKRMRHELDRMIRQSPRPIWNGVQK